MNRPLLAAALFALAALSSSAAEPPELSWVQVTKKAPWQPRDSCGEMVHAGRMWLVGGWFQSFEDPPRDVWSSADGVDWKPVTRAAPFKHSDLSTTLTFKDRIWIMG